MVCDIAFIETVAKIPLPDGRGIQIVDKVFLCHPRASFVIHPLSF